MPRSRFSLKESDRMIRDVIDEFFEEQNIAYDQKELLKTSLTGNDGETPLGYRIMEDGSLTSNEEMTP